MQRHTVLPAEWAPQSAIMLTWPHPRGDWRAALDQAERTFATLATQISLRERVLISCHDEAHRARVQELLGATGARRERVHLYTVPSNDSWARDHGPITVYRDARPVLLNFRFNGWGSKFAHELDDEITARLHALGAFGATALESVGLILEGGSIESDGQGTLLTTTACLLSANRNGLSRAAVEQRLAPLLGIEHFLWLEEGHLAGDDTDSHVDTLARFCDGVTIAYQACDDAGDVHFHPLKALEEELRVLRTAAGTSYRLVPLPLPGPRFDETGRRLPAGYANFLILNGAVLVPTYDDAAADELALLRLRGCFPGRQVVGVPCLALISQYGSLHCVTMQLPEGVLPAL